MENTPDINVYRGVVNLSPQVIIAVDPDDIVLIWNTQAERLLGYSGDSVVGKRMPECVPIDRLKRERFSLVEAAQEGRKAWFCSDCVTNSGSSFTVRIEVRVLDEQVHGSSGYCYFFEPEAGTEVLPDVFEADRLAQAHRTAKLGFWELDAGTSEVFWSSELFRMFGLDPGSSQPLGLEQQAQVFTKASWNRIQQAISTSLETGDPYEHELEYETQPGESRWMLARGEACRDAGGKVSGLRGTAIDITQLKQAQLDLEKKHSELKRSNRDLEQFAYAASHDLQEPLRAVAGCAQMLKESQGEKLDQMGDELIQHIVEGAERMKTLIQDLLTYSRVNSGDSMVAVDTNEVSQEVQSLLSDSISESEASIHQELLPGVRADRSQVRQLFQNLIGNAIKYRSEEPPKIEIRAVEHDERFWRFSISDNGIGIKSKYLSRVFGIFQRLHTRSEYPGTGIGLALCLKIIKRHEGALWVESSFGEGSTFFFTLPKGEKL